jgi:GalNAc-alpha-(1->4)-GalNAc-alpha-(1->3)-diNAcBac-PP-undecaprenol alpha-1,4-N-acetyl-D-galactosaminyltransferase
MVKPQLNESDRRTVLLVIGSLQGGGAERQISDMANYWVAKDWNVILATWSGPEVADFYPLDTLVLRVYLSVRAKGAIGQSRIRANLGRVARLRRLLISARPGVVLSFMTEGNVLTILAGVGLNLRVVVSERTQPALHHGLPWTWRILRRGLYAWADAVVAQTQDAAHWLERNCRTVVTVIPNALRRLPEPSGERRASIVAVGRLSREKGFDVLLRAFARIAPTFGDWSLTIIGEGEERQSLTRLCGELLLNDRVEFVGQSSDIVAWMARAGLVVQPSRFEGFPNVVLEGMGLGAAVISANCPSGPSDMIEDRVNGRLVPVDDVDKLAEVMTELISCPEERARLGRAASSVRERYRQDIVMDRWEACLFPQFVKAGALRANRMSESR